MKINFRKQELLRKYLDNECSQAELEELFDYLKSGEDESYREVMDDLWKKICVEKTLEENKADHLLEQTIKTDEAARFKPHRSYRWYYMAAAVLALAVVTGSIYLFSRKKEQSPRIVKNIPKSYNNDIKPGGTKAVLQAGNVQVALSKKDTSFTLAGNTVHINSGDVKVADVKPVQYTLITPRGGEYSLVLADGTRVWLNADSKLIYPSLFSGNNREVSLEGEAYFEVKKDAERPFIVHTEKQDIKVLGTEFNIHAYPNEDEYITTLVKGKVQVNSFGKKMLLVQGQQATSDNNGQFSLQQDADIKQAIAWKEGYFRFDNTEIHDIMRQLSRWYDVKVNYAKDLKQHEFMAIISRDNNISQVLGMLEETGAIHFKIEGHEVTVMQ